MTEEIIVKIGQEDPTVLGESAHFMSNGFLMQRPILPFSFRPEAIMNRIPVPPPVQANSGFINYGNQLRLGSDVPKFRPHVEMMVDVTVSELMVHYRLAAEELRNSGYGSNLFVKIMDAFDINPKMWTMSDLQVRFHGDQTALFMSAELIHDSSAIRGFRIGWDEYPFLKSFHSNEEGSARTFGFEEIYRAYIEAMKSGQYPNSSLASNLVGVGSSFGVMLQSFNAVNPNWIAEISSGILQDQKDNL